MPTIQTQSGISEYQDSFSGNTSTRQQLSKQLEGVVDENNALPHAQYDDNSGAVVASKQAGGAQSVSIAYGGNTAVVRFLNAVNTYTFTSDSGFSRGLRACPKWLDSVVRRAGEAMTRNVV